MVVGSALERVAPSLEWLVLLLFIVMYEFCFMGVQLYGGKITRDKESRYYEQLEGLAYASADYWPNNFNDMPSGMTTLFIILVGSNWQLLVEAFCTVTNKWSRLYFYTWSLVGTAIAMNLVVASVLDVYVNECSKDDTPAETPSSNRRVMRSTGSLRRYSSEARTNSITIAAPHQGLYVASIRARELYNVKDPQEHLRQLLSKLSHSVDATGDQTDLAVVSLSPDFSPKRSPEKRSAVALQETKS